MKSYTKPLEIDLVYLWVDGSDQEWLAKKKQFLGESINLNTEATSKARNADNDELKYSLRSAEKYAPWIRRIFVVTDEQTPKWLNLQNEKIEIVDIRKLLPAEALPCYNSVIIEHFLYKIPGLSEHFLYANDDMFSYQVFSQKRVLPLYDYNDPLLTNGLTNVEEDLKYIPIYTGKPLKERLY